MTGCKHSMQDSHVVRQPRGSIAELPVLLWIVFLLIAVPLINLTGLGMAAAGIYITSWKTAEQASCSLNFKSALKAVVNEADYINKSGLAAFSGMTPAGGYQSSGVDLFVQATNLSGGTQISTANQLPHFPIDTTSYVYEYKTNAVYDVKPLVSLAAVPLIGQIPGLGKPARIAFSAHRVCEFPVGLNDSPAGGNFAGGSSPISLAHLGQDSLGVVSDPSGSSWNHPSIYREVLAAGEKVVQENVLYVYANNPEWTDTMLNPQPGDSVWIDYSADGTWKVPMGGAFDDHGKLSYSGGWVETDAGGMRKEANFLSGTIYNEHANVGWLNGDGTITPPGSYNSFGAWPGNMLAKFDQSIPVVIGKNFSFKPPKGKMYLKVYVSESTPPLTDAERKEIYSMNSGRMLVRIVVTRKA